MARTCGYVRASSSTMLPVASWLPSLTTITSKSGVSRPATCTARMTRLAIVPASLYAGKKTLNPTGRPGVPETMDGTLNRTTRARSGQATEVLSSEQAPWQHHRFGDHASGQLRRALPALDEGDRHLDDPGARTPRLPRHFHLKRVSVRQDPVERQAPQQLAPPAAEAAGAVADRQPGDRTHVPVRECAEQQPAAGPVAQPATRHVARADDQVGVRSGLEQPRQLRRIVRKVGVHLAHMGHAHLLGGAHAVNV